MLIPLEYQKQFILLAIIIAADEFIHRQHSRWVFFIDSCNRKEATFNGVEYVAEKKANVKYLIPFLLASALIGDSINTSDIGAKRSSKTSYE